MKYTKYDIDKAVELGDNLIGKYIQQNELLFKDNLTCRIARKLWSLGVGVFLYEKKETHKFEVHALSLKTYHLINDHLKTQGFTIEVWSNGNGWTNVEIKRK